MCATRLNNSLWTFIILLGTSQTIHTATLWCFNRTIDNYQEATFTNSESLISSTCINTTLETIFYSYGFGGMNNGNATTHVVNAYLNDIIQRNVVLLNWQKEASPISILGVQLANVSYPLKAVTNSILIGKQMTGVLINLSNYGLNLNNVILVGHSLGAHVWGNAGRGVIALGKKIARITGLDPAGPFYDTYEPRAVPLNRASGKFVMCIHTDPGSYGINTTECTVDVWVNYNHFINGDNVQPGCLEGDYTAISTPSLCSHDMSWRLLIEALLDNNKMSLQASKASNYSAWVAANGMATDTIYIGDLADPNASPGNYYMSTNPSVPYGKGADGLRP